MKRKFIVENKQSTSRMRAFTHVDLVAQQTKSLLLDANKHPSPSSKNETAKSSELEGQKRIQGSSCASHLIPEFMEAEDTNLVRRLFIASGFRFKFYSILRTWKSE